MTEKFVRTFISCPHCEYEYYVPYDDPEFIYTCKNCEGKFVVLIYYVALKGFDEETINEWKESLCNKSGSFGTEVKND